jgi:lysophospholipase L1-like esterase
MRRPVLTASITLAVAFALAEVTLRVAGFVNPSPSVPMLVWNPNEDVLMQQESYLYRYDENSLWSPRPGATVQFDSFEHLPGPQDAINADGFRGARVPLARTPGTVRIAALGDSSTFGLGLPNADTYCARLPAELAGLGVRAEVINAGAEGFSVFQGLEHYRHRVRPYRPDVVIAAFGAVNDAFSDAESDVATRDRRRDEARSGGGLRRWLRQNVRVVQGIAWLADPGATDRFLRAAEQRRRELEFMRPYEGDPGWPFGRRVPLEQYSELLRTLASEVEQDGGRLIVVVMPRRAKAEERMPVLTQYTWATQAVAAERGLQVLNVYWRFRREHTAGEPDPPLFLPDWWHPSAAGHAAIAAWLAPLIADPARNRGRDSGL